MLKATNDHAEYFTTSDAARMIGIAEGTVRLWAKKGIIKVTRTEGGMRLFAREDVETAAARAFAMRDST